ncbi:unnamed protein product [Owenia fusiformis]|uniref:Uncharacterized protein n=1 Tax=Owenia fusiformis TaxID=6347 RepID=A0A8J1UHC0_OWEFU|nr:unnamed protein product [Owenia fusiformis]
METNMSDEEAESEYSQYHEYHVEEQNLQDNILALQRVETPNYDLFRPSLAEQQKIGFFGLDRATQTEVSEIIEVKELTEVLQELLQDVNALKRDILFAKQVMQADYESKLESKALEMYCRINERLEELERQHEDRVDVVRRAFKQQLSDALARMAVVYTQNFDTKLKAERKTKGKNDGKHDEKIKEMQATIQRNESIIQMMKMQIQQYQARADEHDHSAFSTGSPSIDPELEELREDKVKMEKKIDSLEHALDLKEETTTQLNYEIAKLNEQLEKERILIEQLKYEQKEQSAKLEQDKASNKRLIEQQKLEMETNMAEHLKEAKQSIQEQAKRDMELMQKINDNKMRELVEQKQKIEEALVKERSKNAQKREEASEYEKMKKVEVQHKKTIEKLKKEIERIHKTWEKKFAILQQSLHALKDESFLRQTMQRQAAQLHQASISYASDTPLGILPNGRSPRKSQQPLPDIPRTPVKSPAGDRDYISYTVSAPSGRGTGLFSLDENQVMSDEDADLPPGMVPLPAPPSRKPTDCGDDSRPSTRSHVVVLPSVEAQ